MRILFIFPLLYALLVSVGLVVCLMELSHALWVYRQFVKHKINSVRQVMAMRFVHEEIVSVLIQVLLLVPAVVGILLLLNRAVQIRREFWYLVVLSQLAHMGIVLLLAMGAIGSRVARRTILNMLDSEETKEKT